MAAPSLLRRPSAPLRAPWLGALACAALLAGATPSLAVAPQGAAKPAAPRPAAKPAPAPRTTPRAPRAVGDPIGTLDGQALASARFAEFVLAEQGKSGAGLEALDHLVQAQLVALEATRRGILVTERDLDDRVAALDQQLKQSSDGKLSIADQLAAMNLDASAFRTLLRQSIACERMMGADYGLRSDAEIPREKQSLWFQELKGRYGVRTEQLPAGAAAVLLEEGQGERVVSRVEWGLELFRALAPADADRLFDEYIGIELLLGAAKQARLEVTPEHVAREVQERTKQLAAKLKAAGMAADDVDYLATLRARGDDPDAVLASDRFRAEILLKELARQRYGADGWKRFYADHKADFDREFGRRVRVSTIHLRADAKAGGPAGRTLAEATAALEGVKQRAQAGDVPVAEAFASFARLRSEHESAARGGDLGFLAAEELERAGLPSALLDEKQGALVGPLPTLSGAHLLRVTEQRAASPFEEVVGEVEKAARRQLLQELRKAAKVERKI